jgi:hypothetical protein
MTQAREFTLDNMQVCAANTTGAHPQQKLPGRWLGLWDRLDMKRARVSITRRMKNGCLQEGVLLNFTLE